MKPQVHSQAYTSYLASPEWREVRLRALNGAGWRCERCHARARLDVPWLEVNHKHYRRPFGQERWPADLEALCPSCHRTADRVRRHVTWLKHAVRYVIPWAALLALVIYALALNGRG